MSDWVIFEAGGSRFGVRADQVSEMAILGKTTALAHAPVAVRGLMNLRGRVVPVLDLRLRLGQASAPQELEELCELLNAREQDHVRWLNELGACAREGREFKLALDPTKCAFGKWYYAYRPDNPVLRMQLSKLAEPHRRIHETGAQVMQAVADQDLEHAQAIMEATRTGTLATLQRLLAETRQIIREEHREIAIIADSGGKPWGLIVDAVTSVQHIAESQVAQVQPGTLGTLEECLLGFCQLDIGMTLLLDFPRLSPLAACADPIDAGG